MRIRVVRPEQVLGLQDWIVRAVLVAFIVPGVFIASGVLYSLLGPGWVSGIVVTGAVAGILIAFLLGDCSRARYWWIALSFGTYVGMLTYLGVRLSFHIHVAVSGVRIASVWIGAAWVASYALIYLCGWVCFRTVRGAICVQDGTLCPNCGYCLLGCPSSVCPECGRDFTPQELGKNKKELNARATGGRDEP